MCTCSLRAFKPVCMRAWSSGCMRSCIAWVCIPVNTLCVSLTGHFLKENNLGQLYGYDEKKAGVYTRASSRVFFYVFACTCEPPCVCVCVSVGLRLHACIYIYVFPRVCCVCAHVIACVCVCLIYGMCGECWSMRLCFRVLFCACAPAFGIVCMRLCSRVYRAYIYT